eukprot:TRINITY_DN50457_c0_g1_i1.p1 TRINITY_DN50457_c0_g1~~TRINITY_DN50457_c0_g1_i1.p1  ORF type:complete len:387 (-),score=64.02 TRINITY_DN50457_c0_g1_i1:47-1207(-)
MDQAEFAAAASAITADAVSPWEWIPASEWHSGYMVRRNVSFSLEGSAGEDEADDVFTEEEDLNRLVPHQPEPTTGAAEFHALFSQVFKVPVMYFNAYHPSGMLASVQELVALLPMLSNSNASSWCHLTQAEHPVLGLQFFMLHPCNTHSFMSALWSTTEYTPEMYLRSWLSLVETTLNLTSHTPPAGSLAITPVTDDDRDSFDLIIKGLGIGNATAADDLSFLRSHRVTHVLNMTHNPNKNQAYWRRKDKLLQLAVHDQRSEDVKQHFERAHSFIDQAIAQGGLVFVHCHQGISRSSTIVISYLMKTLRLNLVDALRLVRARRSPSSPPTHPNGGSSGFFSQLVEYEAELHGCAEPSLSLREYTLGAAGEWSGSNNGQDMLGEASP